MRLRLGLLQDAAAIERQIAREAAEAEAKRNKAAVPTVKTEAQMKADQAVEAKKKGEIEKRVRAEHRLPKIRPLSESKAIDSGANFVAETFLFLVAGGLVVFENWRSKKKEQNRRDARDDEIEEMHNENSAIRDEVERLRKDLLVLQKNMPEKTVAAAQ